MAYIVKMPKLGMGMSEGILLEWFVSPGDEVSDGDPLAEIESEKTVAEITASEDGVLRLIYVEAGETVDPGTPLGIVAEPEASIEDLEAQVDRSPREAASDPATADATTDSGATVESGASEDGAIAQSGRVRASPRAKKRATELGVEIETIDGSGPQGAITVADVEDAATEAAETAGESTRVKATPKARRRARELDISLESVEGSGPGGAVTVADIDDVGSGDASPTDRTTTTGEVAERVPVEERELGGMRQAIADNLGRSYREAVHVTVHRRVGMEEALAATEVLDDYLDVDATVTDLILVAVSATLDEHPEFNATFEDGVHRIHRDHNIGVAVDIENGLITPVLSAINERSLEGVVRERRELTDRALSGDYTMDDLSGGTFTVSNLGVLGVDSFTPIINPPQVAILGINRFEDRPVRTDDGVGFQRFGSFDLSFDHRVVDGADAARFLDTLASRLADPWPLLLERA